MCKVTAMPKGAEGVLPAGTPLTELEYEMNSDCIPFGCKAGACGSCIIEVLDGLANLSTKEADEAAFLEMLGFSGKEFRLACQCRLNGAVTLRSVAQ